MMLTMASIPTNNGLLNPTNSGVAYQIGVGLPTRLIVGFGAVDWPHLITTFLPPMMLMPRWVISLHASGC